MSIIFPVAVINTNTTNYDVELIAGSLVMPLSVTDNEVTAFLPCSGFDPHSNQVPSWAEEVKLTSLMPSLKPQDIFKKWGTGKITVTKGDYTSIKSGQVEVGDTIACRGEWNDVGDDAFFPEGYHNIIRFTKIFTKNVNKQPFDIIKLQGKIMTINKTLVDPYQDVTVVLDNITSENVGNLKVTYRNML